MDPESSDNGLNGDGDKQILAPEEGPRENLISTAVKFLQNPKVMSSPLYQKKAFLEKKGLTQEEIQLAVTRSGVKETSQAQMAPPPPGYQPGIIGGPSPVAGSPVYAPLPPQSRWARARDLAMTTVIVAGVSYGMYHFFQKYLRPWLLGKTAQEARLERMDKQMLDLQRSVEDLAKVMSTVQASLQTQTSQYSAINNERVVSDLKGDIASLKGLLLNRNQFPPAPATSVMLPAWQRNTTPGGSRSETGSSATPPTPATEAPSMASQELPSSGVCGENGVAGASSEGGEDSSSVQAAEGPCKESPQDTELSSLESGDVTPQQGDSETLEPSTLSSSPSPSHSVEPAS